MDAKLNCVKVPNMNRANQTPCRSSRRANEDQRQSFRVEAAFWRGGIARMGGGVDGGDGDMAPLAGDDDWLARKENEAGNRQRDTRWSAEDAPVAGTHGRWVYNGGDLSKNRLIV